MASMNCEFSFEAVLSMSLRMAAQGHLPDANLQQDEIRSEKDWNICQVGIVVLYPLKNIFQFRRYPPFKL